MEFSWQDDGRTLTVTAPAKLNLYLEVLRRRSDGFHDIDTLMQAISLADELEFRSRRGQGGRLSFEVKPGPGLTAEDVPPASSENLVCRAANMLRDEADKRGRLPDLPDLDVTLYKNVPMGAGLGGGSSDAAATLLAIDRLWELDLDAHTLQEFAAALGSDVAFFLHGGMARCQGRGEVVQRLDGAGLPSAPTGENNPFGTFYYVVVTPLVHVSSSLIYKSLSLPARRGKGLTTPEPLATMNFKSIQAALAAGELIHNRLQEVAFERFPALAAVFRVMCDEEFGAVQLTGSGAAIFGTCENAQQARQIGDRLEERLAVIGTEIGVSDITANADSSADAADAADAAAVNAVRRPECRVFVVSSLPGW